MDVDQQATVHWLTALAGFEAELEEARNAAGQAARQDREQEGLLHRYETELTATVERSGDLAPQLRALEGSVQDLQAQIERKKQQQDLIRDNKEYKALTAEIENLSGQIDAQETEILTLIEKRDEAERETKRQRTELEQKRQEISSRRRELAEVRAATEARQEEITREIATCTSQLHPDITARLERMRTRVPLPVVWLDEGACGGCYASFPTQIALEIEKGRSVVRCQACGRYVVART